MQPFVTQDAVGRKHSYCFSLLALVLCGAYSTYSIKQEHPPLSMATAFCIGR